MAQRLIVWLYILRISTDKNASSANTTATSPKTGDMTPIAIYVVMAVAAMGVIVFVKKRKTA